MKGAGLFIRRESHYMGNATVRTFNRHV